MREGKHTEPFLVDISQAIEAGAEDGEEVAFYLIATTHARGGPTMGGDVVGAEEHTHTANADENAENLCPMITNFEDSERKYYDHYDGPEVDELGR